MVRKILAIVFLGLSLASGYFYHALYFIWRDCFNELGRCFDAESGVVYSEQSGVAWLSLAVLAFAIFLSLIWWPKKRRG